jgi:hypothetical protein
MKDSLKTFWVLIGIGFLFCCLTLDQLLLTVSPVKAASEMSVSQPNYLLDNFGPRLNAHRSEYTVVQLPGGPSFKNNHSKEAAPLELAPPPTPRTPSESLTPSKALKTSALVFDGRAYGSSQADLEKALAAGGKESGFLHFSAGTWNIAADLTIPASTTVRFDRGALLKVTTQKGIGTLSHADAPCAGTIDVTDGSTLITGSGTEFGQLRAGQFIICEGQRREIRSITDKTHLEIMAPFHTTWKGKPFSKSTFIIQGSGTKFSTELEVGDFLYLGKEKHIVTSISGPDSLTVAEYPKQTFSGEPFARSIRVKIEGSLEAGLYQIFSGKGVVKFAPGAVTAVHPEWWGAKGNGNIALATTNSDAIEKSIYSLTGGHQAVVQLSNGKYQINRPIVVFNDTYLLGQGMCKDLRGGTVIQLANHSNCPMVKDSFRVSSGAGGIKDIMFNMGVQDAPFHGLLFANNYKNFVIQRCGFVNYTHQAGGYAIYLGPAGSFLVVNNFIMSWSNGIMAYGYDSWFVNNEIATTGEYGIYLVGDGNIVQGNIIYGDGGCLNGIFVKSTLTNILGNRINDCKYGLNIHILGGIISGNGIVANKSHGIYSNYVVRDAHITDNKIFNNKGCGIFFSNVVNNSIIKNNTITGNNGGATNPQIDLASYAQPGSEEPLVEDNVGVDLQCNFPILPQSAKPAIRTGKRWKTANTIQISIIDFLGGCKGKEIMVFFEDSHTTLKFSGNSNLKGHGGLDWTPSPGDHMRAIKVDNGYWYCECFASTSKN